MKTKKLAKSKFASESLRAAAMTALNGKLKVYIFQDATIGQFFLEDSEGNISTVSGDHYNLSYGTVHKACKRAGTGFQMQNNLISVSIKDMYDACKTVVPVWARHSCEPSHIKKYSNFAEKMNLSNLEYKRLVL